ncbi:2OG-Fe(II) oxygenase [Candidatus Pelagibacter sp.]|nr:2OG-Fe(II) oxygenase [Candidatus Pelagibacter sp.]
MFVDISEKKISETFIKDGFVVLDVTNKKSLKFITEKIKKISLSFIKENKLKLHKETNKNFFDQIHKSLPKKKINDFRLSILKNVLQDKEIRQNYYLLGKKYLDMIVGNELSMQRRINLSVNTPNDPTSILNIHTDVWSGDSPFEVVMWVPLVDCFKTKRMFIVPPKENEKVFKKKLISFGIKSTTDLYKFYKKKLKFIDIKFGQILIFNQNLLHGGVINKENTTRWSLNCRFKNIFTPYDEKKLGEFFEPITLKAASKIGIRYFNLLKK